MLEGLDWLVYLLIWFNCWAISPHVLLKIVVLACLAKGFQCWVCFRAPDMFIYHPRFVLKCQRLQNVATQIVATSCCPSYVTTKIQQNCVDLAGWQKRAETTTTNPTRSLRLFSTWQDPVVCLCFSATNFTGFLKKSSKRIGFDHTTKTLDVGTQMVYHHSQKTHVKTDHHQHLTSSVNNKNHLGSTLGPNTTTPCSRKPRLRQRMGLLGLDPFGSFRAVPGSMIQMPLGEPSCEFKKWGKLRRICLVQRPCVLKMSPWKKNMKMWTSATVLVQNIE